MHTITTDNGSEFACHQWIAERLGVQVYFTDSYASWQKGAVENINKLVRQYIPHQQTHRQENHGHTGQNQCQAKEKLNFNTPKQEFFKHYI